MPKSLEDMPEVSDAESLYLKAYYLAAPSRSYIDGTPMPIAISEMVAVLQVMEIVDIDDRLDYIHFIQICDEEYRSHVKKPGKSSGRNLRRQGKSPGSSNGRSGGRSSPRPPQGEGG